MRDYLAMQGVAVPEQVAKGRTGNKNFMVKDPDGHNVEIVEYQPDSWTAKDAAHTCPRLACRNSAMHVGILVGSLEAAMKFYNGILGFEEFWRGSAANSKTLSWVNMRVPDGDRLHRVHAVRREPRARPARLRASPVSGRAGCRQGRRGAQRAARHGRAYTRPVEIRTGINRKRQVNLFDPDGTRVELMEPEHGRRQAHAVIVAAAAALSYRPG